MKVVFLTRLRAGVHKGILAVTILYITKHKGKKRAIIAIARISLTATYFMLFTSKIWIPIDLFEIDMPEYLEQQRLGKAVKQVVRFQES